MTRKTDWRVLNIDSSIRPKRCHERHIYGPLQPMDREERSTFWSLIVVAAVVATFAASYIGSMS